MRFRDRPIAVWAFPLAMLASCLTLFFFNAGGIDGRLSGILFDSYQYMSPRVPVANPPFAVRVLNQDRTSLEHFGPWPWPRTALTFITEKLSEAGAAAIVFAAPLERPDPASPQNLIPQLPADPGYDAVKRALSTMPSPDTALADAFGKVPVIVGFSLGSAHTGYAPAGKVAPAISGTASPSARVPAFNMGDAPLPELDKAARGAGGLNLLIDGDGKLRRMPSVLRLSGNLLPSLDAEALRVVTGAEALTLKSDEGRSGFVPGAAGIESFRALSRDIPTSPDGSFWIAFSARTGARDISATDLASGKYGPGSLARSVIYIGAPDQMVETPDGPRNVTSVHAEALENLLSGAVLRRPASALEAELICLAVVGLGLVLLFARFGTLPAGIFTVAAVAAGVFASWYFYSAKHVLFDALSPSLGLSLTFLAGALARSIEVGSAKMHMRQMFEDSLPPATIAQIARNPDRLKLDGENRTITYLSCGVRGFAQLASSFPDDPSAFTGLMNRILPPLMERARLLNGAIDRLTPDGFTAFWNAPLDDAEHAMHACEAAHAMTVAIAHINESIAHERRRDGSVFPLVEIGVGIATGSAIAGGVLTHGRTSYSVNGDCTVTASRIQALSEQYGPAVIVLEETRKAAERGFAFLEVDYIEAGPHDEAVKLYAMLGNPVVRASPKFRALMTFHDHIFQALRSQQWQKARELIEQCRKLSGASQKLYDLHLKRIAYFEENPPGKDWDGVFRTILK